MSIRCSSLLLAVLVALAACRGRAPAPAPASAPAPQTVGRPLLPALEDPDPTVRRDAAEQLGGVRNASRRVIDALLFAQYDDDESVSEAAVAALDRIHPGPDVALRVFGGGCYEDVADDVIVRPEVRTWRRVDCEPTARGEGEQVGACWTLVVVPAVTQARVRHVLAHPEAGRWRDARDVRADDLEALRAAPPPPTVPPLDRVVPPEGEPEGAQPGEVWCWTGREAPSGGAWHRHPECEAQLTER